MTELLLQPAQGADDPSSDADFDVIADGEPVGRIVFASTGVWFWTIDASRMRGHDSFQGYEATREAAMQAFAKSWHRE
jgi:hypothetical protein